MADKKLSAVPCFKNRRTVYLHLQGAGYELSEAKLYRDFDKGLIKMQQDGSVLEIDVRKYVNENLTDVLKDIQSIKNQKEVEKLEEQIAKLRFDREKEMGNYIPKKDFEAELAARAAIFDIGFSHLFTTRVREWIALVGGRPEKSSDFLQALNQAKDEQLNVYSNTKIYQVMFAEEV